MNDTAKKLREAADYTKDYIVASTMAIARVRDDLGLGKTDTFATDLGAVLDVIADELDELQARAAEANCLRQQLKSAEDKAERRKRHIGYLDTALHDKNVLFKHRGEALAKVTKENAELRKQAPSERERQILALWPKWSNGDYCMFGDLWTAQPYGEREPKQLTKLSILSPKLLEEWDQAQGENFAYEWDFLRPADTTYRPEKAEPPALKMRDADGVEINVGDKVWLLNGIDNELVVEEIDDESGWVRTRSANGGCLSVYNTHLTHTLPDSWELLEEDAAELDDMPCDFNAKDLIRRAKALAGVEVAE